ncbi:hypothetical protein F1C76_07720 [Geodermatophilaceae bacterium NBWT11]|nr:hypothetical protein F1C76_07720 [Geodermatophilaceae bacterium NBWT11]
MRHLLGIVVGLVLTAAALAVTAVGVGQLGLAATTRDPSSTGLAWVLVGGVLFGLLAASRRVSPVSPFLGGALLIAGVVLTVQDVARVLPDVGDGDLSRGLDQLVYTGTAAVIGALLVVLALVPQGRRVRRAKGDDGREDDGFTAVPQSSPQAWSPPQG